MPCPSVSSGPAPLPLPLTPPAMPRTDQNEVVGGPAAGWSTPGQAADRGEGRAGGVGRGQHAEHVVAVPIEHLHHILVRPHILTMERRSIAGHGGHHLHDKTLVVFEAGFRALTTGVSGADRQSAGTAMYFPMWVPGLAGAACRWPTPTKLS
jgi:hypothetical protein